MKKSPLQHQSAVAEPLWGSSAMLLEAGDNICNITPIFMHNFDHSWR